MCWLDDTFYSKCEHWGRAIVKTPCAIGLQTPHQIAGCWHSQINGISRIDEFCQNCRWRHQNVEGHEFGHKKFAPEALGVGGEMPSAGQRTSVFRNHLGQTQVLGAMIKGKKRHVRNQREEAENEYKSKGEDEEQEEVGEPVGEKQFEAELDKSRSEPKQQTRMEPEGQVAEKGLEKDGKKERKLFRIPYFQGKLGSWHPFGKRSRKERLPQIEEQSEDSSEAPKSESMPVTSSLLRGLQQAFEKKDETAIMLLLEFAAGKKIPPLSSSLKRGLSHAVISHDLEAFHILLEAASSAAHSS